MTIYLLSLNCLFEYIFLEQEEAKILLDISNGTIDVGDFRKRSSVCDSC